MPRLSSITRPKIVTADVDVNGELLHVEYNANGVTLAWSAALTAAHVAQDVNEVARLLCAIIVGWDIANEDGSPLPVNADTVALIPSPVLERIMEAMRDAAVPSDAEGKASSAQPSTASSDFAEPPQTSPNGQATSLSPELSAYPSPT